jgi:hypothetical protein
MEPIPPTMGETNPPTTWQEQWVAARRHVHTCPPCHAVVTRTVQAVQAADLWDRGGGADPEYDVRAGAIMAAYTMHRGLDLTCGAGGAAAILTAVRW